jgi:hypothetical protein
MGFEKVDGVLYLRCDSRHEEADLDPSKTTMRRAEHLQYLVDEKGEISLRLRVFLCMTCGEVKLFASLKEWAMNQTPIDD